MSSFDGGSEGKSFDLPFLLLPFLTDFVRKWYKNAQIVRCKKKNTAKCFIFPIFI